MQVRKVVAASTLHRLRPPLPRTVEQPQACSIFQSELHGGFRCKGKPHPGKGAWTWRQALSIGVPAAETSTHRPCVHCCPAPLINRGTLARPVAKTGGVLHVTCSAPPRLHKSPTRIMKVAIAPSMFTSLGSTVLSCSRPDGVGHL